MGNNNKNLITGANIATQLESYKQQLIANMSSEELEELYPEKKVKTWQEIEIERRKRKLLTFFKGFLYDSDLKINNFFRKRSLDSVSPNELRSYRMSMISSGILIDQDVISWEVSYYLIDELINLSVCMGLSKPLETDTIFYRGCSDIDSNGVNGVVAVTSDMNIAKKYSKGTILTIVVPKGTRMLDIGSIWQKSKLEHGFEKTYILPPCDYNILSSCVKINENEPRNPNGTTQHLKISVTPLDMLEEFLKVMENPPKEYEPIINYYRSYESKLSFLKSYLDRRNKREKVYSKTNSRSI